MTPWAACSVVDMWRAVAILALALLAAACGGGEDKPLAETARPCLEQLGAYLHHEPAPATSTPADTVPRLPLIDPDNPSAVGQTQQRLPWPDDFQEYGEVSYRPDNPGANAVQVFIFGDEELPRRIVEATERAVRSQSFFTGATNLIRIGPSLVQWSSLPTPKQRAAVRSCLVPD